MTTYLIWAYLFAGWAMTLMSLKPIAETFKSNFDRILMILLVWVASPIWGVFYLIALAREKLFNEQGIDS
jgi:hypothetical protein